jgi:hypothetical protein
MDHISFAGDQRFLVMEGAFVAETLKGVKAAKSVKGYGLCTSLKKQGWNPHPSLHAYCQNQHTYRSKRRAYKKRVI